MHFCASWYVDWNIALVGFVRIVDNYREGDSNMDLLFVIQLLSRFMNRKSHGADSPGTHETTCGSHIRLSVRQDVT